MTALFFGLLAFSAPAHAVTNQISTVSPSSAEQGTKGLLVSFTLDTTPPPPPTNIAVSSVTIGNIAGTVSPRTEQTIVSALFDIPGLEKGQGPGKGSMFSFQFQKQVEPLD